MNKYIHYLRTHVGIVFLILVICAPYSLNAMMGKFISRGLAEELSKFADKSVAETFEKSLERAAVNTLGIEGKFGEAGSSGFLKEIGTEARGALENVFEKSELAGKLKGIANEFASGTISAEQLESRLNIELSPIKKEFFENIKNITNLASTEKKALQTIKFDEKVQLDTINDMKSFDPQEGLEGLHGADQEVKFQEDLQKRGLATEADVLKARDARVKLAANTEKTLQAALDARQLELTKAETALKQAQTPENFKAKKVAESEIDLLKEKRAKLTNKTAKQKFENANVDRDIAQTEKNEAQKAFNDNQEVVKLENKDVDSFVAKKRAELDTVKKKLETQQVAIDKANTEFEKADKELVDAQKNEKNPEKLSEKQAAYDKAKEKLETAKNAAQVDKDLASRLNKQIEDATALKNQPAHRAQLLKESQELKRKLDSAQATLEEKEAAFKKAQEEYLSTASYFDKGANIERAKIFAKEKATMIAETFVSGVVFMIPNYLLGSIEQAHQKNIARASIGKPQKFGDVWMRIPNSMINETDPSSSVFIYVGMTEAEKDNSALASNADYIKSANMYVVKPEYTTPLGKIAMTDSQFTDAMIHLNTGYTFVGNGEPEMATQPTQAIFTPADKALIPKLDKLAGRALGGVTSEVFSEYREQESKIQGSKEIAENLSKNKNKDVNVYHLGKDDVALYPPVMNDAFNTVHAGTTFGKLKIREATGLADDPKVAKAFQDQFGPKTNFGDVKSYPYILGSNLLVYQTRDTGLILGITKQYGSDATDSTALILNNIVDYVVPLDGQDNVVPLQEVSPDANANNFAAYVLSKKVSKVRSLIDGAIYKDGNNIPELTKDPSASDEYIQSIKEGISKQITGMKTIIADAIKYGPFSVGGKDLVTTQKWVDEKIPVYKVSNALENGGDDYIMPLIAMKIEGRSGTVPTATLLPNADISFFISLVTSRIYTNNYAPYNESSGKKSGSAYIVKNGDSVSVSMSAPSSGLVYTAKSVPLYTMFMDSDLNPNTIPQNEFALLKKDHPELNLPDPYLPVQRQWALLAMSNTFDLGKTFTPAQKFLQETDKELLEQINASYTAWHDYVKKNMTGERGINSEMGPFVFDKSLGIHIRATGLEDFTKGVYVYTTAHFQKSDYWVLADNKEGTERFATLFDPVRPQKYALSLSNGFVYANDGTGLVKSVHIDPTELVARIPKLKDQKELFTKIKNSQALYNESLKHDLYTDLNFAGKRLFLDRSLYFKNINIYADVSDIVNAWEEYRDGKLNLYTDKRVQDYYLCGHPKKDNPSDYDYGLALGGSPDDQIINLVNGAIYTLAGYEGSYTGTLGLTTLLALANASVLEVSKQQIPAQLLNRITQLNKEYFDTIMREDDIRQKQQAEEQKLYPSLIGNIANNLDSESNPYIIDPYLGETNLKKYGNKYYGVAKDTDDNKLQPTDIKYIDFNYGDEGKDNNLIFLWRKDRSAALRIDDPWEVKTMRAKNGIYIDATGKQVLGMPIDHPGFDPKDLVALADDTLQKKAADASVKFNAVYDQLLKAFADNKSDTELATLRKQLNEAAQQLSQATTLADAAAGAPKISGDVQYTFYYFAKARTYFVRIKDTHRDLFVDLRTGLAYGADGTPLIRRFRVMKNNTGNGYLFYQFSVNNQLMVSFGGQPVETAANLFVPLTKPGSSAPEKQTLTYNDYVEFDISRRVEDKKYVNRYEMSNTVNPRDNVQVYSNDPQSSTKDKYDAIEQMSVYRLLPDDIRRLEGIYFEDTTLYCTVPTYWRTKDGSTVKYDTDDARMFGVWNQSTPERSERGTQLVYLLWDGGAGFKFTKIKYKDQLLDLQGTGPVFTTATGLKVTAQYDKAIEAHWLTIQDGAKSYDFMYEPQAVDTEKLNEQLKVRSMSDASGKIRLVPWLTVLPQSVDINQVKIDEKTKQKRGSYLSGQLAYVKKDPSTGMFFYAYQKTTSDIRDAGKSYYRPTYSGGYVNLTTGIVYKNQEPIDVISQVGLTDLLDKLELSVYVNANGQYALAYRSAAEISREEEENKNKPKIKAQTVSRKKLAARTTRTKRIAQRSVQVKKNVRNSGVSAS